MKEDEGGGGDGADAPGAEADPAQRLEGGLEQGVAAFGRSSGGRVQQVDAALVRGQPPLGGALDRGGQRLPLAFVAQVGQGDVLASVHSGSSGSASGWVRSAVVSCSRPGHTAEVQIGQPSGAAMTCTLPPWAACLPDHHRSTDRKSTRLNSSHANISYAVFCLKKKKKNKHSK